MLCRFVLSLNTLNAILREESRAPCKLPVLRRLLSERKPLKAPCLWDPQAASQAPRYTGGAGPTTASHESSLSSALNIAKKYGPGCAGSGGVASPNSTKKAPGKTSATANSLEYDALTIRRRFRIWQFIPGFQLCLTAADCVAGDRLWPDRRRFIQTMSRRK